MGPERARLKRYDTNERYCRRRSLTRIDGKAGMVSQKCLLSTWPNAFPVVLNNRMFNLASSRMIIAIIISPGLGLG